MFIKYKHQQAKKGAQVLQHNHNLMTIIALFLPSSSIISSNACSAFDVIKDASSLSSESKLYFFLNSSLIVRIVIALKQQEKEMFKKLFYPNNKNSKNNYIFLGGGAADKLVIAY